MAEIFISYSRRDKEFVRRLGEALAAQERVAWVDWKDIPLTAEWQQEILTNIEAADSFVFVLSPDSAASFNCRKEIDHAAANNKRMVPILYRSVPDNDVPETLARFQRIDLSEESLFDAGFAGLVKALDTDLPWVQMHTRLLTRAKEWERQARDTSFLLRGKDLRDAEQWIARRAEHEPKPTPLQVQYLQLSRRAATRQRRIIVGTAVVTFLIAAGLAVYAFVTQGRKEDALARSLAGRSASILSNSEDTELAALLALESVKRRPTEEGAQALRNALVYLRRTHALFGGGQGVSEIAFSPDSKRLVTIGRNDAAARVFDVDTGKERLRLQHDASVMKAVFSPDGRFVITGSEDKTARIWDAAGGRELHRLVCDSEVFAVTMSKDGLAGTGSGTAAQVWDVETGRELVRLEYPRQVKAVAFSPSGRWFAGGAFDGSVQLWDRSGGSRKALGKEPTPIRAFGFSPADETHLLIAAAGDDASADLSIVDITTAKVLAQGTYRNSFPLRTAFFTADPNKILVYGEGKASVWDAHLKRLVDAEIETVMDETVLSADGRLVMTFHAETLSIKDISESGKPAELARISFPERARYIELSPDGRLLAVGGDTTSRILEVHPPLESLRLVASDDGEELSFSPGGRWAAIASEPSSIMDLERPWEPPRPLVSSGAETIAMNGDGTRVVTGTQTKLTIWDAHTGEMLKSAPLPGGKVPFPLAFSADSTAVVLRYGDDPLKKFEWASGKWSDDARFQNVHGISGDAHLMAVRPDDHSIQIVDADTHRLLTSLPFEFAPFRVEFGGHNKLMISVEQRAGVAHVWDLESKKELGQVSDFDRISSASLSPDGRLAATSSYGSSVRFQLWRKDDLIRHACEIIARPLTREEWKQYLPEDTYAGDRTCAKFRSPSHQ